MTPRPVFAASLVLALAACGSGGASDEAGEASADTAGAVEAPEAAASASEIPEADATPADGATATPTPAASATPTPTPTATRAAATPSPTPVAAAGPPDSFRQCAICHKVQPGQHGLGPSLANVFGAKAGHAAGYNYSPAIEAADLTWNQANLDRFLASPQSVVPGTTMAFGGVKDAAKRAEIIAYLKTL